MTRKSGYTVALYGPEKGRRQLVGYNTDKAVIEHYAAGLRRSWATSKMQQFRPYRIAVREIPYCEWKEGQ